MASSEDFQRVYELYKKQGVPKGISIVKFCQYNGIVYSQFERWFKSRKQPLSSSIHPVRIVDEDGLMNQPHVPVSTSPSEDEPPVPVDTSLRFSVTVRTNQGLSVQQNNLSYRQLFQLVEKLEAIC